tara:strand:- start:217 stop:366 length:150 start_codon:yes stop_codon:yes gene_type:complete
MTRRVELDAATVDKLLRYLPRVVPRGTDEANELHGLVEALAYCRGTIAA